MSGRHKISDGIFLAILPDGTIAGGVRSSNPMPKVYTTVRAARSRVKGGGYVLRVTDKGVELVAEYLQPKTFFLNEQHELPPAPPTPPVIQDECSACGDARCYNYLCYGID